MIVAIWWLIAVVLAAAGAFVLVVAAAFIPDYLTCRRDPLLRWQADSAARVGAMCAVVGLGLLALAFAAVPPC